MVESRSLFSTEFSTIRSPSESLITGDPFWIVSLAEAYTPRNVNDHEFRRLRTEVIGYFEILNFIPSDPLRGPP